MIYVLYNDYGCYEGCSEPVGVTDDEVVANHWAQTAESSVYSTFEEVREFHLPAADPLVVWLKQYAITKERDSHE